MSEAASSVKTRKELEKENHLLQERLSEMQKQLDERTKQNAVQGEQLANLTERHAALESKYDLERLLREETVERELQKRMAEARQEERAKMDKEWRELERQKADARKELETMLQSACAKVEGEYAEKMEKQRLRRAAGTVRVPRCCRTSTPRRTWPRSTGWMAMRRPLCAAGWRARIGS